MKTQKRKHKTRHHKKQHHKTRHHKTRHHKTRHHKTKGGGSAHSVPPHRGSATPLPPRFHPRYAPRPAPPVYARQAVSQRLEKTISELEQFVGMDFTWEKALEFTDPDFEGIKKSILSIIRTRPDLAEQAQAKLRDISNKRALGYVLQGKFQEARDEAGRIGDLPHFH